MSNEKVLKLKKKFIYENTLPARNEALKTLALMILRALNYKGPIDQDTLENLDGHTSKDELTNVAKLYAAHEMAIVQLAEENIEKAIENHTKWLEERLDTIKKHGEALKDAYDKIDDALFELDHKSNENAFLGEWYTYIF